MMSDAEKKKQTRDAASVLRFYCGQYDDGCLLVNALAAVKGLQTS